MPWPGLFPLLGKAGSMLGKAAPFISAGASLFGDDDDDKLKKFDPYKFFKQHYGRDEAQLLDFYRKRLGRPDDAYASSAYKSGSRRIASQYENALARTRAGLVGRGTHMSGAGRRAMADASSRKADALSDLYNRIITQRETEIPRQLAGYLSSVAGGQPQIYSPPQDNRSGQMGEVLGKLLEQYFAKKNTGNKQISQSLTRYR